MSVTYDAWRARSTGNAFDDDDVARAYDFRPPYAPAAYEFLADLAPQKDWLVDLGCGPGKVAAALADRFESVVALDASGPMIARARELHEARHSNIRWQHARAEDADLPERIDLVTAATSIHWMKHEMLFPDLAQRTKLVAVITGDDPADPPWRDTHDAFLTKWLARIGRTFDRQAFKATGQTYEAWLDVQGERRFDFSFNQSIDDFVACQHSRATFSRSRMGDDVAVEFDGELAALLKPYERDGLLSFGLTTYLTWGVPRPTNKYK